MCVNAGMETGTPGTGKYEGMTWNGKRWTRDGDVVATNGWQRTSLGWRVLFIGLAAAAALAVLAVYQGWV